MTGNLLFGYNVFREKVFIHLRSEWRALVEIKRDVYLKKLIRKKKNGLIKVVTGVRRCGKSYLLFHLFHNHLLEEGVPEDHMIEVALDDRRNKALRDPDAILRHIEERMQDKGNYYDKLAQEQRSLLSIPDSFRKIIVVGGNQKVRRDENGIAAIGLRNFLLDEDSLRL